MLILRIFISIKTKKIIPYYINNNYLFIEMQTNVTTTATTPTTSPSTTTSATDSSAAVAEPSTAEENQQRESSDPTVAPIIAGRECYIEIPKDNVALGINIVGGCDTPFVSTVYQ